MFLRAGLVVLLSFTFPSMALTPPDSSPDEHFTSYYEIDEPQPRFMAFAQPIKWLELAQAASEQALSLMEWELNRKNWPEPKEKYNRKKHFGSWLRDPNDGCLNTRGKILIRASEVPVTYAPSGCSVATGQWHEPYSNQVLTDANALQIDHMVPLKNAYVSGAWKLDALHRCAYSNFMANGFHLIPVAGEQNSDKSDKSPDAWMPPNQAYSCEYLKNWLSVKLIWGLIMNPRETEGIRRAFQESHCDRSKFQLSESELAEQRRAIEESLSACRNHYMSENPDFLLETDAVEF